MAECRSCGAKIEWIQTKKGKNMPIDVEPVDPTEAEDGTFLCNADGRFIKVGKSQYEENEGPWFISHFATCPNADQHRSK